MLQRRRHKCTSLLHTQRPNTDSLCSQLCHAPVHLTSLWCYNCWQGVMKPQQVLLSNSDPPSQLHPSFSHTQQQINLNLWRTRAGDLVGVLLLAMFAHACLCACVFDSPCKFKFTFPSVPAVINSLHNHTVFSSVCLERDACHAESSSSFPLLVYCLRENRDNI